MKTTKPNLQPNQTTLSNRSHRRTFLRNTALLGAALTGVLLTAQAVRADDDQDRGNNRDSKQVGDIFVIALENHDFTQPPTITSPQQILGNPAAPFINSLITPGNSNAVQVSYATDYLNAGVGVHPSEPNYVWAEAGSDFGFHSDADPSPANGNTFYDDSLHLTSQLDFKGIPWRNYQEDVQLSLSPTNSASGTNGPVNPYNGSTQYNYAVKHNPMAFFSDSRARNVYPLAQLFQDLTNHTVGRYNWITPDQYNEAHSSLNGGFTYQGVHYTGDQSSIAAADNFLSIVLPQIMASKAYKNNGVIVLWWDESEGGDSTNITIPEIIISPLAKGNAYASSVPLNHSSDIKTWEAVFGLPSLNNPIPVAETNNAGDYNNVAVVNDLSDLFAPGVIPATPAFFVSLDSYKWDKKTQNVTERLSIRNISSAPAYAPLWLVLDNLSSNATLLNADGTTAVLAPLGDPYVSVPLGGDGILRPWESKSVVLEFSDPTAAAVTFDTRVLNVTPAP
jgi:hypothetical protein